MGFTLPKLLCVVPKRDIFLTDIMGYDRLKYLKIYIPKMKFWLRYCLRVGSFAPLHRGMHILKRRFSFLLGVAGTGNICLRHL